MRRLREILRNEYIGAIAIGFLLFQAAGDVINVIMQPIVTYMQNRARPPSVFAGSQSIFHWPEIIVGLTDVVLHLLVAFLLILWLYRKGKTDQPAPAVALKPAQS